jgi:cytochrome P450
MWRYVPTGGKSLHGHYLPGGTEIGMNVWALSRNKAVYGEDAAVFRPERWLEDPKKVREWEKIDAYFGMGNYMCLGKNIAMMELYKITAEVCREVAYLEIRADADAKQLFRNFDIVVSNPSDPWNQFNALAFACKDFDCQIYTREKI